MPTARSTKAAEIASYRDLQVWQVAMSVAETCVVVTRGFPPIERFGLAAQIRRAAVSIPSNIAEGHGRRTSGSYLNHLCIAAGSHAELETQVELALRLGYLSGVNAAALMDELAAVGRLLTALIRVMRRKLEQKQP